VEVKIQLVYRTNIEDRARKGFHLFGARDADGIPQRNLVDPEAEELFDNRNHLRGGHNSCVGALKRSADIASHPTAWGSRPKPGDHLFKGGERLLDRHVDVFFGEGRTRGGENCDSVNADLQG